MFGLFFFAQPRTLFIVPGLFRLHPPPLPPAVDHPVESLADAPRQPPAPAVRRPPRHRVQAPVGKPSGAESLDDASHESSAPDLVIAVAASRGAPEVAPAEQQEGARHRQDDDEPDLPRRNRPVLLRRRGPRRAQLSVQISDLATWS